MSFVLSYSHHHHLHLLCRLVLFLHSWISITFNRFMLYMVQCHHLQLRCFHPLFCNVQQFNIKLPSAYHVIIQKKVDKLLTKGTIEPSSGGAVFYSQHICCS